MLNEILCAIFVTVFIVVFGSIVVVLGYDAFTSDD